MADINIGDKVGFHRYADYVFEVNDEKLFRMQDKYLTGKFECVV